MGETGAGGDSLADISALLWVLAAVVMALAVHVALGYLRFATREARPRGKALQAGFAALALGSGIWSAMLLGLASQALNYALGFSAFGLLAAWGVAVLVGALSLGLLLASMRPAVVVGAGALAAAGALFTQMLLVRALGLAPGLVWHYDALAVAAPVAASGCIGGLWLAFLAAGRSSPQRRRWRWAAAAMMGLALIGGQELVMAAAAMGTQKASLYLNQVPGEATCLVAGLAVPLVMLGLLLEQRMRRYAPGELKTPRRKRRRVRTGRPL
jgi:NO-binding membrane sensor protein with MHYT domain